MSLVGHAERDDQDRLDDYIEAQVHGPLRIEADVEALVLDACFRNTDVQRAAAAMPCAVEWHGGFRLAVAELCRHRDYRGRSSSTSAASSPATATSTRRSSATRR